MLVLPIFVILGVSCVTGIIWHQRMLSNLRKRQTVGSVLVIHTFLIRGAHSALRSLKTLHSAHYTLHSPEGHPLGPDLTFSGLIDPRPTLRNLALARPKPWRRQVLCGKTIALMAAVL